MYQSIKELIDAASASHKPVSELMIEQEITTSGASREVIWAKMERNLQVMEEAVKRGKSGEGVHSPTGLTGGEAVKIKNYAENHQPLSGKAMMSTVADAIATNEVNAAMGIICATPTAGSSGTMPGVLMMLDHRLHLTHEQKVRFLFAGGAYGLIIANNACIAGASGGCQAEVGSASGMAAAAAVEIAGGTPEQAGNALAIALANLMGLVCDPVAGLVEVPCVKRNAIGAGNALISADMALAGCTSKIPVDEVVAAMNRVGRSMPASLRETGLGGIAGTPTGQRLRRMLFHEDQ